MSYEFYFYPISTQFRKVNNVIVSSFLALTVLASAAYLKVLLIVIQRYILRKDEPGMQSPNPAETQFRPSPGRQNDFSYRREWTFCGHCDSIRNSRSSRIFSEKSADQKTSKCIEKIHSFLLRRSLKITRLSCLIISLIKVWLFWEFSSLSTR